MGAREDIVGHARWAADNEPQIHYSQGAGRFSALNCVRCLPLWTDCSAIWTLFYKWAGAPDPNGRSYDGYGYTGTMVAHLPTIDILRAQPGDLVVYGPGPGDHVAGVVYDAGSSDPMMVSHGQESGPRLYRHSVQARAHRPPWRCFSGMVGAGGPPPPPPPPPEERIVNAIVTDKVDGQTYELDLRSNGTIGIKNIREAAWSTVGSFDWQKYGRPVSMFASTRDTSDASAGTIDLSVKTDRGVIVRCGKPHGHAAFDPWWN